MIKNHDTKSQVFLMEFILVVLFFAICVTICLKAFVLADHMSKESKILNHAALLAQSTAECIETCDYANLDESLNLLIYPEAKKQGYRVEVVRSLENEMLEATIFVSVEEKTVCKLQVQKYTPDEVQ